MEDITDAGVILALVFGHPPSMVGRGRLPRETEPVICIGEPGRDLSEDSDYGFEGIIRYESRGFLERSHLSDVVVECMGHELERSMRLFDSIPLNLPRSSRSTIKKSQTSPRIPFHRRQPSSR